MRLVVSAPTIHFKGSGWAKKDARSASAQGARRAKGEAKGSEAKGGEVKGGEAKGGDAGGGEAKAGEGAGGGGVKASREEAAEPAARQSPGGAPER